MDDCEARVHNHAFENFLMAGVEAYASQILEEVDPPLSWKAYTAACEDYQFARKRFEEKGMELPSFYEHSYNSSLSQYWATASWAASQIYSCQLKGMSFMDAEASMDKTYAVYAADYAGRMLACQESGNSDCPASGFFYREPDHKQILPLFNTSITPSIIPLQASLKEDIALKVIVKSPTVSVFSTNIL